MRYHALIGIICCITAAMLCFSASCLAQHAFRHELHFRNDNDLYLFNKQDQYYTNGIFLSVRKTSDTARFSPKEINRLWQITVGQQMYNAYTAQIHHPEEVDRPITAYLFLAASLDRYFVNETFLSFATEIGTIGQRALGRQFQESIHRVFKLYEAAGWEYQLENAFGLNVASRYGGLLYRNPSQWFDVSGQINATLGFNHTGISTTAAFRFGRFNPLHQSAFFTSRLQTSGDAVASEFFCYYAPELNLVGYDATVQGGMFLRDKGPVTHTPNRLMLYNRFGAVFARNAITLRLQYTFYSKEVPGMFFRHRYGSVGVGYRF